MENFNLNELGIEELDNLMEEVRVLKKTRKEELKEANKKKLEELKEANKKKLEELQTGATVRFILKGEENEGNLVKITDQRFVVIDFVDSVKKAIMFDKLVEIID
jgi:hypothetical protein